MGRYYGKTLQYVAKKNLGWIVWAIDKPLDDGPTIDALRKFSALPDIAGKIQRWRSRREKKLNDHA